jgi:hypothetical protein
MSSLVLLKFNSATNANFFRTNPSNVPLQPSQGDVTVSDASGILSGYWVTVFTSNTAPLPPGFNSAVQVSWDLQNKILVFVSPNIDITTLHVEEGDNTIVQQGLPSTFGQPPADAGPPQPTPQNFDPQPDDHLTNPFGPGPIPPSAPTPGRYVAPAVHFDGTTVLDLAPFVSPNADFFSFAGWFKSNWSGSQIAFVIDPAGNNNLFLKIVAGLTFVAGTGTNCYYSSDGLNWNVANVPISGVTFVEFDYLQGMWAAQFYTGAFPGTQFGWITTFDGINWSLAIQSTQGDPIALTFVNDNFVFTPVAGPDAPVTIQNPSPSPPILRANDMDATQTAALADPSQVANAPTIPPGQVLFNPLPSGFTAIRRGGGGTPFQYTKTRITNAIVSGGITWPGATWITPPGWSVVVGGADIFYGANATFNQPPELSYAFDALSVNADVTKAPVATGQWQHIMGTIDQGELLSLLYFGNTLGGVQNIIKAAGSATNGKTLYLGGDTGGGSYTGDMSDLYFYPNVSFIDQETHQIQRDIRGYFITPAGAPVDPFGANGPLAIPSSSPHALLAQPSVFCHGKATLAPPPGTTSFRINSDGVSGGVFQVTSGGLTDANSSPSDIWV